MTRRVTLVHHLLLTGALAPLLYAGVVIVGGALAPGYKHFHHAISELTATDAPLRTQLEPGFALYNILVVLFGLALFIRTRAWGRRFRWGSIVIGLTGVLGLAGWPFPMDAIGAPATLAGVTHIWIAGFLSLGTMTAMSLFGLGWLQRPRGRSRLVFTFVALATVFSSGLLAASAAVLRWPMIGLLERITIGTFLVWMFVTAIDLWLCGIQQRRMAGTKGT